LEFVEESQMTENADDLNLVPRSLQPSQRSEVWIAGVADGSPELVYSTGSLLLEAPNWSPDGRGLLLNGDGRLWRLDLVPEVELKQVPIAGLPPINNDHVLDAERGLMYLSANDGHIYVAPVAGGTAGRVTHDPGRYHFLHGVSPDGATLAFVELPRADFSVPGRLALVPSAGGETRYPQAGRSHLDGPEYSPDGAWLYLNTEEFASCPGHAQLARVPAEGGRLERLAASRSVDWFPHLSPDGKFATYLSFPPGTVGHPPDLDVEVRLVRTTDWRHVLSRFPLFGGQGTLNVNSWSPDGRRFAFVAYPVQQKRGAQ
jgi:dipeptidyl aminopeptidase/acylaminoacyl peptidase